MKPSIRKQDGRWVLTRLAYGFNQQATVREFPSWRSAMDAAHPSVASAGPSIERGHRTLGLTGRFGMSAYRGTIRMEDTA